MSHREVLTPEQRALEVERMIKCVHFAAGVFTVVSDSFQKSEHQVAGIAFVGEFGLEQFAPLLKKHNLLCADWRKKHLLDELGAIVAGSGVTSCAVWEYAHHAHHIIFDEDLPGQ